MRLEIAGKPPRGGTSYNGPEGHKGCGNLYREHNG